MQNSNVRTSIVIPNWNGSGVITDCLTSIKKQSVKPHEIIVVDNGSIDDSAKIIKSKFPNVNKEITAQEVRLVGKDGEMIGVVSLDEALRQAKEASLDLVEISPTSEPPVCKILDFSRYKYNAKKKLQEAKKKQKKTALKEMKFKVNIGQGDLDIKLRKIREFLEERSEEHTSELQSH